MIIIPLGPILWLIALPFRIFSNIFNIRLDGYKKAKEKYVPHWVENAVWDMINKNTFGNKTQDFSMKLKGKRYKWKVDVSDGFLFGLRIKYYSKKRYKGKKK
jgi:hypothetical protein